MRTPAGKYSAPGNPTQTTDAPSFAVVQLGGFGRLFFLGGRRKRLCGGREPLPELSHIAKAASVVMAALENNTRILRPAAGWDA